MVLIKTLININPLHIQLPELAQRDSLQFQDYFANFLSRQLMKETGMKITFESALVPQWKDGTLRLENVNIQCDKDSWIEYKTLEFLEKGLWIIN